MDDDTSAPHPSRERILVIGEGRVTDVARRALDDAGAQVVHLRAPNDRDIRRELSDEIDAVIVISRDDRVSLRVALVVEGVRPGVRLIVTVYDLDIAAQLRRAVRNLHVTSMADIVAPTLAGPCFDERLLSVSRRGAGFCGVRAGAAGPEIVALEPHTRHLGQRLLAGVAPLMRPFELSARILLAGLMGFLVILLIDTIVVAVVLGDTLVPALYSAIKTIVTVGPNPSIDNGPAGLKLFSGATMLAGLAFTATFTAGVVNRLLDRRLVAIMGPRSMPRSDHVVVVGLGQVGLRLCLVLRALGVPVVAIERDPDADNVARAKAHGIPVVIGRGGSRFLLSRLSLGRARAFAAVTSDEIENVSTVVAALAMRDDLPTVLRAGGGEVMNETRALFSIGVVRDVYRIGGTLLAAAAMGSGADEAFLHEKTVYLIDPEGRIEPFGVRALRAGTPAIPANPATPADPVPPTS